MIRAGATDAPALARELTAHSGLEDLRRTPHLQLGQRSTELKAHSALSSLQAVLTRTLSSASRSLNRAADRLLADTHVFRELRVLSDCPPPSWRSQAGRPAIDPATVQACACAARSCEARLAG
ncbi:hypothetical protein [Rhodococcus sp. WB9]|uniref:hypothetical protein n=1 Tax=Rhodococcus sp. WB9 TaxID=2594007 RepID=UPI0021B37C06|nr:hypothetical protein [Rhodococcus sp. WB9]